MSRSHLDAGIAMNMGICSETAPKLRDQVGSKSYTNYMQKVLPKIQNKKRQARNTSGPDVHKRVQTQNRFATLQEDQSLKKVKAQTTNSKEKT